MFQDFTCISRIDFELKCDKKTPPPNVSRKEQQRRSLQNLKVNYMPFFGEIETKISRQAQRYHISVPKHLNLDSILCSKKYSFESFAQKKIYYTNIIKESFVIKSTITL